MNEYFSKDTYLAKENTVLDKIDLTPFLDSNNLKDAFIHVGAWQSWNPGFEISPCQKQDSLKNLCIKNWNKWLVFPESKFKASKNKVLASFISYIRFNDYYILLISVGNISNRLPPLQFIIDRKKSQVSFEIADKGKSWKKGELQAQVEIITARGFVNAKNTILAYFGKQNQNKFLGWESWYNYYEKIDENIILSDLNQINQSPNFIKLAGQEFPDYKRVFQIDDGWQISLGDWDCNKKLFPSGLKALTQKIEENGFIPGIWCAPLIIDIRSKFALEHPDYLLRDKKGNLVKAGWNPRWGANGIYYCLDLSKDQVQSHLKNLMNKIINDWGFRYIKLDFLFAGMFYGAFSKNNAAYENFHQVTKILTEIKKNNNRKEVYYLGCGMPMEMGFKNFPLSRIGCDTYEHWDNSLMRRIKWNGRASAYLNLKDTLGKALWNGTVFQCDPDVIFIRNNKCSLTLEEKKIIAFVNSAFGSQIMFSDNLDLSPEEEKITLEILALIKKYQKENFNLKYLGNDLYEVQSLNYKGIIDLGENRKLEISERFRK
ncbi:MAG: alpha-galactosidase [Treponema sp.]|nr:alpha-galactosidase [Treponema sp.]